MLPATSRIPSALDIDPALLATRAAPRPPRTGAAPPRGPARDPDEATERRVERARLAALAASATTLVALSAGALHLAL